MPNSIIIFPRVTLGSVHNSVNSPHLITPPSSSSHRSLSMAHVGVFYGLRLPPRLSSRSASCSLPRCYSVPNLPPANSVSQGWKSDHLPGACVVTRQLWPRSRKQSPRCSLRAARLEQSLVKRGRHEAARGRGHWCHARHVPRDSLLESFQERG